MLDDGCTKEYASVPSVGETYGWCLGGAAADAKSAFVAALPGPEANMRSRTGSLFGALMISTAADRYWSSRLNESTLGVRA